MSKLKREGNMENKKLPADEQIKIALTKNPITRDRLILMLMKPTVKKCVEILLRRYRRKPRLHTVGDLIQIANLTIIRVIQENNFAKIDCAIRTYIIGAIKRKIYNVLKEEFALKRHAQTKAYPLDVLERKTSTGIIDNDLRFRDRSEDVESAVEVKDIVERIKNNLRGKAREIFIDLEQGYEVKEIAERYEMPMQSVYTLLRRKIKPVVKKFINVE